ncbi:TetR/AcrR family transcriptional regulator [Nocardia violaceofusca]|uniref:TetR/AcrR family transcriptional regulator n=1 Tax=Nocardia violaceofusca TaxID=941182 RepID=UPI0018DD161A|nr:TetR/AcrR family transcriptional regulator [Nocardia violaceofusca]
MSGRATAADQIDPESALRAQRAHGSPGGVLEPQDAGAVNARARGALRTRAALIRAGRRALGSGRAARLGIADLARHAGVATGSFYTHFRDKDELLDLVIAEGVEDLARVLDNAAAGIYEPVEVVRAQVRALGALGLADPDAAAIVLAARSRILDNPDIRSRLSSGIRAGLSAGCFHVHDVGAAVDLTCGVVVAMLRTSRRDPAALTAEWIETLAQQVLFTLGHPVCDGIPSER